MVVWNRSLRWLGCNLFLLVSHFGFACFEFLILDFSFWVSQFWGFSVLSFSSLSLWEKSLVIPSAQSSPKTDQKHTELLEENFETPKPNQPRRRRPNVQSCHRQTCEIENWIVAPFHLSGWFSTLVQFQSLCRLEGSSFNIAVTIDFRGTAKFPTCSSLPIPYTNQNEKLETGNPKWETRNRNPK